MPEYMTILNVTCLFFGTLALIFSHFAEGRRETNLTVLGMGLIILASL